MDDRSKRRDEPVAWENFPGYLIDKCEGETITEEGLQRALADMLADPYYAPQPAEPVKDETLWCLHVLGPDDVHAAPSKAYAEVAADLHNVRFGEASKEIGVMCKAVVAPWPYDPASHARGLVNFVSNWIAPQPQQIPYGYKLVPIEPTEEMIESGWMVGDVGMEGIYKAMLEAAPEVKP